MTATPCTTCRGSKKVGKKKTYDQSTLKPRTSEPIPCPDCK